MEDKTARIIKTVVQVIVVVGAGFFVRHKVAETHALMWVAAGWLLTASVVLRIAHAFRQNYAKFRTHTPTGITLENIDKLTAESLSPLARGFYMMEKRVYRGAWRTMIGKPLAPAGEFSVAGGPRGKLLAMGCLLFTAVCAAAGVFAVPESATAFWPRVFAFALVAGVALYAAIWIVGIRRNLKEGGHRITHDELILDLGIRCSGAVALDSIASCSVLEPGTAHIASADVWKVSPGEPANVRIQLFRTTELAITSFGSAREIGMRFIALYVDQPAQFVEAMSEAMAGARRVRA